jgi:hypothetical protein
MNAITRNVIRPLALVAALAGLSATTRASLMTAGDADRACQIMDAKGSVTLASVGPGVEVGASKETVSRVLGRADVALRDGSWMFYRNFYVDHSIAHGSLVVSFSSGRVSALRLVTPLVAVALVAHPEGASNRALVALSR